MTAAQARALLEQAQALELQARALRRGLEEALGAGAGQPELPRCKATGAPHRQVLWAVTMGGGPEQGVCVDCGEQLERDGPSGEVRTAAAPAAETEARP